MAMGYVTDRSRQSHGESSSKGCMLSCCKLPSLNLFSNRLAGCPTVVANLWDVTDLDIDRFSRGVLDQWLGAEAAGRDQPPLTLILLGAVLLHFMTPCCLYSSLAAAHQILCKAFGCNHKVCSYFCQQAVSCLCVMR